MFCQWTARLLLKFVFKKLKFSTYPCISSVNESGVRATHIYWIFPYISYDNLLLSYIYAAANALKHVFMSPSYKIISICQRQCKQKLNLSSSDQPIMVDSVLYGSAGAIMLLPGESWWNGSYTDSALGPGLKITLHLMKQLAHKWHLPYCHVLLPPPYKIIFIILHILPLEIWWTWSIFADRLKTVLLPDTGI